MKNKKLYYGLIAALALVFLISAIYLISYFAQGKKEADRFSQLAAQATTAATVPTETAATQPGDESERASEPTFPRNTRTLDNYKELHDQNEDMVGWLRIEDTVINYPVMQTPTDRTDYYLYRNFDKKDSAWGSIYAREQCDILTPGDNITLYGHNMRDGSMFAHLLAYQNKSAWEANPLITFDTLYEYHTYKIFAVFKTTASVGEGFAYHKFENAKNAEEFDDFVAQCRKLSFYDTGIIPAYGDKLLCLSTCEYTLENGRFIVAAVQIS